MFGFLDELLSYLPAAAAGIPRVFIHFYLTNCFDGKKIQIRIEEISVVVH